jgi:N6-L-threonylcarbamoyladenine synthase
MQAHALTPRMVSALEQPAASTLTPDFPFLSVLASGGHTLLIHSSSVTNHSVLGTTNDIAIGECLDKVARILLPVELLQTTKSTMYGALLEKFAFEDENTGTGSIGNESTSSVPLPSKTSGGSTAKQYLEASEGAYGWYRVPANHEEARRMSATKWGWGFDQPLAKVHGGTKINSMELSFSGLLTAVQRVIQFQTDPTTRKRTKVERKIEDITLEEKRDIAREVMRAAFEHVAYRVTLALKSISDSPAPRPAVVMAGGVAANSFLRYMWVCTTNWIVACTNHP